jgi:hypothetical protein
MASHILLHWRWKLRVPLTRWQWSTRLHGITYCSTLKMEAAGSSETFIIIYQTTRHHIFFYPEHGSCGFLRNASHILPWRCELHGPPTWRRYSYIPGDCTPGLDEHYRTSRNEAKQSSFCLPSHTSLEFPACTNTECPISKVKVKLFLCLTN